MGIAEHMVMLGPAPCASCGRRGAWLCAPCVEAARPPRNDPAPVGIDAVAAGWAYEGGPRSLVLALKLRHLRDAARPLVEAMVRAFYRHGLDAEVVSWVPARRRDLRTRGFDHAEVLARALAERVGLPTVALLERRGSQRDQSGLGREERSRNLHGAFRARETLLRPQPQRVLLVDDLLTTGATATACASALRATGVTRVGLLVACRA